MTTGALARSLAVQCRELGQNLLDSGAETDVAAAEAVAERRVFDAFLARDQARQVDWNELYQAFLAAFAPQRRRALGVYYTPAEVVRAQVRLAADLLEQRLGCRGAYADPRVLIVDPAAGSGAYPLAVVADVRARTGQVASARTLVGRLRLFEPLAGAASIARAQLGAALGSRAGLQIDTRNALDGPLTLDAPIVVCLGNPPYHRHPRQARTGTRLADLVELGAAHHAKNLYNAYVYFWRWALAQVFEQRHGPGIVSFVTPSSYLRGPGFGGLRRRLRDLLDELWIVDLEGDHLAARSTANVFPIRTPVAIAMGVRYAAPVRDAPAAVHYARIAGDRQAKLAALDSLQRLTDVSWRSVPTGWTLPFIPAAAGDYASWPPLTELFPWQLSGAQLKRTWPIAATEAVLRERWERLLALPTDGPGRATAFRETRDRNLDSAPADLRVPTRRLEPLRALAPGAPWIEPVPYAYRSFDRQWVLPDARLGDFMRPALWRIVGPRQIFLTSLLTNVLGPGPAAVATTLVPDLDCFRGSFGARAVIPLWQDACGHIPNIAAGLLERLAARYGFEVGPERLLAYCYAVLGTPGFQARFEEELRTPGPRVPVTEDPELFGRAAALGERLLWLHTYGLRCVPVAERAGRLPAGRARGLIPVGADYPRDFAYDGERETLRLGNGAFGPIPPAVWSFGVSGLRVVPAWLGRRVGRTSRQRWSSPLDAVEPRTWTAALSEELLELLWVVEATLGIAPAVDEVLGEIVRTATIPQAALAS